MKKLCKFVGVLAIGLVVHACGNPNNDTMNDDMNNMDNMDMDTSMVDTSTMDTTDSVALEPESF